MKTVQGQNRQYQLVEKTKRKDLDGVSYLVAGESDLWVKLVKDRSAARKEEISYLISRGGSAVFERPLEMVSDSRGFAGYTYRGKVMEVVPETVITDKGKKDGKNGLPGDPGHTGPSVPAGGGYQGTSPYIGDLRDLSGSKESRSSLTKAQQLLLLLAVGIVLFALTLLFLDKLVTAIVYTAISQTAGEGCALLSFGGILPGIVGVAVLILYQKSFGHKATSGLSCAAGAAAAFLCGLVAAYAVIGVLCVLIVSIFGVVQAYQTAIITVIVLGVMVKLIFFS